MRRVLLGIALLGAILLSLVALGGGALYVATALSAREGAPMIVSSPIPVPRTATLGSTQPSDHGDAQILFGDLHVHTNYSADSFLQSYGLSDLDTRRTPADACDFARFCSQLDFWSINDHAESLTPDHWKATVDAIRQCDAIAGDAENPDLVSFLGWEWSHAGSVEQHYGHKNVVLADLDDGLIPTRPIASGGSGMFLAMGTAGVVASPLSFADFSDFHRYTMDSLGVGQCSGDVPSPDLPDDCREVASTPSELFDKLDEWGHRALVIPHGLSWGTTNPAHARLDVQLEQHDPRWQPLLEIYSGHGNSEVFASFERPRQRDDGIWTCPAATPEIEFCCERAGSIVRERCEDPTSGTCDAAVDEVVQEMAEFEVGLGNLLSPTSVVPGTNVEDWGDCGQLRGGFLSAWNYRPRQSAQYALALGSVDGRPVENRFRFGLIGASDNHRGRPGTGYKESGRLVMTDGAGYPMLADVVDERASSFYVSGGLAAVHAPNRDRESIFDGLSRRAVYGTSGDRILLWFDFVGPSGELSPMGSEVTLTGDGASFRVRAMGAAKQLPGCPAFVGEALSTEQIASLCLGECHNPSDERKRIVRIEVVRIASQNADSAAKSIGQRVEDPWRVFECPPDESGCEVTFEDRDQSLGERAYYVRAIQEASGAINGNPLSCERDASGACLNARVCERVSGEPPDDCVALVEERAWSSPIWVTSTDVVSGTR